VSASVTDARAAAAMAFICCPYGIMDLDDFRP
jgi:hypothetical protein